MTVLVTGAAGRLGRVTVNTLRAAGLTVVATDCRTHPDASGPLQLADLTVPGQVPPLFAGVTALVHLGNLPNFLRHGGTTTLHTNNAINVNTFQAALAAGVAPIIFASSIQVVASEADPAQPRQPPPQVAYLPLDSASPPQPTNGYALSKHLAEIMLDRLVAPTGIPCVALRLPFMAFAAEGPVPLAQAPRPEHRDRRDTRWAQAFAQLSFEDAASLILALLRRPLPGFRIYLPAVSRVRGPLVPLYLDQRYPDIPLRRPAHQLTSLIDLTPVTRDTAWSPQHVAPLPSALAP